MQCGVAQGLNCSKTSTPDTGDTYTMHCQSYSTSWLDLLGKKLSLGGCEATITGAEPTTKPNGNYALNDIYDGSAPTMPIDCDVTATYSGKKFTEDASLPPPPATKDTGTPSAGVKPPATGGTGTGGTGGTGTGTGGTGTGTGGTGTGTGGTGTGTGGTGTGTGGTGTGTGGTCDPTKSICEGSGDGSAPTGGIQRPEKIENTVTDSWWETEYEDGLEGVWNEKRGDLEQTAAFNTLNQFSGLPDSGSCPSYHLSLGRYNGQLEPPCMIWPALRAFFLFSTIMLCRRIIFGG